MDLYKDGLTSTLGEVLGTLNLDGDGAENQDKKNTDYKNNAYNVTSAFGFLIGVDKQLFEDDRCPAMMLPIYKKLHLNKNARIIRNLCLVRTGLERNYIKVVTTFRNDIKNIDSIPEYVSSDAVRELYEDGISLAKAHHDIDLYIIAINKEISNRISNVKTVFPEWLNWEYVKPLFLMPDGFTKEGIKEAGAFYNSNRNRYPYQVYMNWSMNDVGNILYCDEKFVCLIYELNEDYFDDLSLVRNAGNLVVNNINEFLTSSNKTLFVVDCENSSPVKLASMLGGLDENVKKKICEVLLFDSHYTTEGWQVLSDENEETNARKASYAVDENLFDWGSLNSTAGINMTHIVVDRLLESKSQVDMTLAVRTTQEVYKNGVDSVVLVSSDSDYWAMIQNMEDVKFMVMLEKEKTSHKITEKLDSKGIHYCFLDDFCTGVSYAIKTETLRKYVQTYLDTYLSFDANKLIDSAVYNSWIEMTAKEKKVFLDNYIKHARIDIDPNGIFRILLGDK